MTLVILTSGIDLTVGSIFALAGAVTASMIGADISPFIAICAVLILSAILGAFSGVIIAKGKLQAFIATLVMMLILRGATLVYTKGSPISIGTNDNSEMFEWIAFGRVFGIPVPIIIMLVVFVATWYLLKYTRLGRYIYALGGNESATQLSGINVDKVKIIVYAMSGLLCAVASTIEISRLSSAQPTAGTGYEMDAIAAVVLGGTSMSGGRGKIIGTLIGALILGFLNNGLNMLGVDAYYQMIVKGGVILLAVLVDKKTNK